ncbi:MAG: sucrase ferredoxin [Thermomicrobiales bacterium]
MTSTVDDTHDADTTNTSTKSSMTFCSLFSEEAGVDPAGSAWAHAHYLMIEIPLPWPYEIYSSKRAPTGLKLYLYGLFDRGLSVAGAAFAPDPAWSVEGMTRIIDFRMPEFPFTTFQRREYLVPTDRATDTVRAIVEEEDAPWLEAFEQQIPNTMRDVFVCTHGAIDACCATYGYPIYKLLRHMADGAPMPMRAWRCSHFGGHQYAATMLDMPEGRYWGHLKAQNLATIIARKRPFAEVRKNYRGWAGVPMGLSQVAEARALEHFGWDWTRFSISSDSFPAYIYGATPEPSTVTMHFVDTIAEREGEITISVAPDGFITSMHKSGIDAETYDAQQFRSEILAVTKLARVAD